MRFLADAEDDLGRVMDDIPCRRLFWKVEKCDMYCVYLIALH